MNTQKDWRKLKRQARKALSPEEKAEKSLAIAKQLLATENYQKAKCIGAYLNMPEEVDVKAIIEQAWDDGKAVYLPVVIQWGEPLKFARYAPDTLLTKDILDIDIPQENPENYVSADTLDMVVTPLVAFDTDCNRIGMGGGFYDRTFANHLKKEQDNLCTLIGVAFDAQCIDGNIPVNDWDVCPDMIVTERKIYSKYG